ncbi:hypothetical protein K493DRAFT_339174 [Basidiobolus meristosporus CBS 931.73]|uniref:Uncharacterized protein n=1 Tax=Basidiobolus meristosporus CBS 931.73 TaxID=1314790 RepID=A0A1Y1Y1J7_9FUNG|nr:hypothetical protein K493DRAFT_339174 [Basidiobolus meristosporus CBS 931.73]|eukprot:ORX91765.1 hypothetical protein K493DRAFT_339174 [Basidiobolus meristosporus CBS 931.73]
MRLFSKITLSCALAVLLATGVVAQNESPSQQPTSGGGGASPTSGGNPNPTSGGNSESPNSGANPAPTSGALNPSGTTNPSGNSTNPTATQSGNQPTASSSVLLQITAPEFLWSKKYLIVRGDAVQFNWTYGDSPARPQIMTMELVDAKAIKYFVTNVTGSDTGYLWNTSLWPQENPLTAGHQYQMTINSAFKNFTVQANKQMAFSIYERSGFEPKNPNAINNAVLSRPGLVSLVIVSMSTFMFWGCMIM